MTKRKRELKSAKKSKGITEWILENPAKGEKTNAAKDHDLVRNEDSLEDLEKLSDFGADPDLPKWKEEEDRAKFRGEDRRTSREDE
ncbi:hypothetical protein AKJ47_01305 [candidate division MSBL1 archaeon SCGC-AAA261G05]|uniref:Uncharacterized protein n=1 Tax=candidate division MSBL1 archaeon SCGC-AAA261G05 TaxID=1698276 RepID=A0A133VC19_9EURY|nr:hypothetical protein AKJ47_01305 [candidate division MSBL1 archaeon SCGC-AAA261G05]